MSETQQPPRVRLGPVASALIEASPDNRQEALDQAIMDLQARAASTGDAGTRAPETPNDLSRLESRIDAQNTLLSALRFSLMNEMKMIRILIASLMSTTNSDQQELLSLTRQAIDTMHRENSLLRQDEQAVLDRHEAAFHTMFREQMHGGHDTPERDADAEHAR